MDVMLYQQLSCKVDLPREESRSWERKATPAARVLSLGLGLRFRGWRARDRLVARDPWVPSP